MTNSLGSLETQSIRIESDLALLDHIQLSPAEASSYIGFSRKMLDTILGSETEQPTRSFKIRDIFELVNAVRWYGRDIDADAIRDFVNRTRSASSDQEYYDRLMRLLDAKPERLVLTGAERLIFLMPFLKVDEALVEGDRETFNGQGRSLIASLDDPSMAWIIADGKGLSERLGALFGVETDHCLGCEGVAHYMLTVLVCVDNEFKTYVYAESNCFVKAPHEYTNLYEYLRPLITQH